MNTLEITQLKKECVQLAIDLKNSSSEYQSKAILDIADELFKFIMK